jgi:hypothetical protein
VTWGAPVVYVLIGIGIQELARERAPAPFLGLLVITQAVSERVFWTCLRLPWSWSRSPRSCC